jgi:hydrogenase maturation protease
MSSKSNAVVIGVGNLWSGDDAAGVLVARALRGRLPDGVSLIEHEGEPTALIDAWDGTGLAIVVDAVAGTGPPGSVWCFDATTSRVPSIVTGRSTHAFTLGEAIELARSLGRMPARLWLVGVEGGNFQAGAKPGRTVARAIEPATSKVLELLSCARLRRASECDPHRRS